MKFGVKDESRLYLGDCLEYMDCYQDNHFDLAIVDPPYRDKNQPTKTMRKRGFNKKWMGRPLAEYWKQLFRISVNQIVWGANNFLEFLPSTNCFIFWDKKNAAENYSDGELAWTSFSYPAKCFRYRYYGPHEGNTLAGPKIHPTQKPVALYDWILKNFAKPGDKIIDTHLGSGSIAIAAHYFGCQFTGIEINKEFYDSAVKRIELETRQTSLF